MFSYFHEFVHIFISLFLFSGDFPLDLEDTEIKEEELVILSYSEQDRLIRMQFAISLFKH